MAQGYGSSTHPRVPHPAAVDNSEDVDSQTTVGPSRLGWGPLWTN
ncbi:hypothetical protein [Alloactinosynnema sp. L-07]|nr:hypothetical protein [Alloactinosynnema sp. L-07]